MAASKKSKNLPKNVDDGLQSAFNTLTSGLKETDALYIRATKQLEIQRQALITIREENKKSNDLTKEQKKNVNNLTKKYSEFQSIAAKYHQDVKDGIMTQEQANKKLNEMRVGFDRVLKSAKLTGKENETILKLFKKMSSEMETLSDAYSKSAKKAELLNSAIDQVGASGIPLMQELGGVLKNLVEKNADGARMALTALGAAAAVLGDKYFNAEPNAQIKAELDVRANKIETAKELAKLDNKHGFIKQRRDLAISQNSIDTANTVNQLTIEAANASKRAAIQFSSQMQSSAAEFNAAGKTALYGKGIGSIGYGAAQMQLAGVGADAVAASLTTATKVLGSKVSSEVAADMALLEKRTGQSTENISSMVSFFKRMNKVSAGTALNMVEGMRAMADSANIDLGGLMEEVAQSSKEALGYQIKSGPALAKQVAYAQSLGISFNDVAKAGKSMVLNYKDSIKKEMELSAMLGRNVNLSEARALFSQGKTDDALKSIKAQGLDPNAMNMFQQEALSQALGGLDLDVLQKVATGTGKNATLGTGNAKAGNKGFLSATQSAQSTLAAQQASISAQTAIVDAKLSGQITDAYLNSPGYKKYQENLLAQQKKEAQLDADENNKYLLSLKGIQLAAAEAKFNIERMYEENKRAALVGVAGAVGGNLIGLGLQKLFGKSNPMPVTIVDGGPLDKIKDAASDKLTDKVKSWFTKKGSSKVAEKTTAKLAEKASAKVASKATTKAVEKVALKTTEKVVAKTAAKALGKSLIKKIPFIGLGAGLFFAAQRAMAGDYAGAALEASSGAASMIPGGGTAASVAIDAALAARDLNNAGVFNSANPSATVRNGKVSPTGVSATPAAAKPSLVLTDVQYQTRLQTEMVALLGMSTGFMKQLLEVSAAEFDRPININGTKLNANLLSAARKNYAVARREAVGAYKAP